MDFFTLIKDRYSCRKFADKPVSDELIAKIIEAGRIAPTAKNVQPVKVWVFRSADALEKVKSCIPFEWVGNAQAVIAVGGTKGGAFIRPSDIRNFQDVDASIVATHIMLAIHDLGLGSTWVGLFDVPKLMDLFPDTIWYDMIAMFPVGWPADDAVPSERHYVRKSCDKLVDFV